MTERPSRKERINVLLTRAQAVIDKAREQEREMTAAEKERVDGWINAAAALKVMDAEPPAIKEAVNRIANLTGLMG